MQFSHLARPDTRGEEIREFPPKWRNLLINGIERGQRGLETVRGTSYITAPGARQMPGWHLYLHLHLWALRPNLTTGIIRSSWG